MKSPRSSSDTPSLHYRFRHPITATKESYLDFEMVLALLERARTDHSPRHESIVVMAESGRSHPLMTRLLVAAIVVATAAAMTLATMERPERPEIAGSAPVQAERPGWLQAACEIPPALFQKIQRGYYPGRSPEIITLPKHPNFYGSFTITTHSGPWNYLQRVPLVAYGPGFIRPRGEVSGATKVTLADVAPTMARLLKMKWPSDRPGAALNSALLPKEDRKRPKLVVVVVWDGGGNNVLDAWPNAWPNLRSLMRGGAWFPRAVTGATQSNTPVAHSTLGTGVWPRRHGIIDIRLRSGENVVDSFVNQGGRFLETGTIADLYDRSRSNRAKVGLFGYHTWHQGMIGHGSAWPGADADDAAIVSHNGESIIGLPNFRFPHYAASIEGLKEDTRSVDAGDGELDGRWMEHPLDSPRQLKDSPVYLKYQTRVIKQMIRREGYGRDRIPDLFMVNYKPVDVIGHRYNMTNPEIGSAIEYADGELQRLRAFLNRSVGKRQWAMLMTADHGQTPSARSTGAWPVNLTELTADVSRHFDIPVGELFDGSRAGYLWVDRDALRENGLSLNEISNFLTRYRLGANVPSGDDVPNGYETRTDEKILAAAWPTVHTDRIADCIFRD